MVKIIAILGQDCDRSFDWVAGWEAEMMRYFKHIQFFYPPKDVARGNQYWHPYTPVNEKYNATQRAYVYDKWIGETAVEVWEELERLEAANESFAIVAFSNGGAIAFEASMYSCCIGTLFVASVPVLSQQRRFGEAKCPVGFYHGTWDDKYFGGHDAVRQVCNNMHAAWFEYEGGHCNAPPFGIYKALWSIADVSGEPPCKRCCGPSHA